MTELNEIREAIRKALEAGTSDAIDKVWSGPRSNEIGFTTKGGENVVLSIRRSV